MAVVCLQFTRIMPYYALNFSSQDCKNYFCWRIKKVYKCIEERKKSALLYRLTQSTLPQYRPTHFKPSFKAWKF